MLQNKLSQEKVYTIIGEAVEYEKEFVVDGLIITFYFLVLLWDKYLLLALPVSLIGMNAEWMCQYIEFVADRLIYALGYNKLYHTKNPLFFMDLISLQSKTKYEWRMIHWC